MRTICRDRFTARAHRSYVVLALGVLLAVADAGVVAALELKCLEKLPAPLDKCFAEFLGTNPSSLEPWEEFVRDNHLYLNRQSSEFSFYAKPPQREQYSGTGAKGADRRETLIVRERADDVRVPYLSSGGWLNIITLKPGLAGHREVTRKSLSERFGFVRAAQDAVAIGAVEPDFYAWTVDAAHAQTTANDFGEVAPADANGKVSRSAFIGWLTDRVDEVKHHCSSDVRKALYRLGYALHAVQDLAAHKGRTYAEHAWNSYCPNPPCDASKPESQTCPPAGSGQKEQDPDACTSNIELAFEYSARFLKLVRDAVGDACWTSMKKYSGEPLPSLEKIAAFDLKRTLTWDTYGQYKASASKYTARLAELGPEDRKLHRIRWVGAKWQGRVPADDQPIFDDIAAALNVHKESQVTQ